MVSFDNIAAIQPAGAQVAAQTELNINAYAKINLTLDVFSKRPDGYHGIASVMQAISLRDTLRIARCAEPGVRFTCDGPEAVGVPTDGTNLAVRAAASALEAAESTTGVAIHLHKQLPSQAGLGGGSSDAAAALVGVSTLLGLDLPAATLHSLAAEMGSDVPFFLMGGTAVARGRGEQLSRTIDAPRLWLVIVKPDENVSTGWAYSELDSDPERASHRGTKRMEQAIMDGNGDSDLVISRMCNDFELPVFAKYPSLAWLQDELIMAGARSARLCGSGSALFGVAAGEAEAERIASQLRSRYQKVYVAHTLTRAGSQFTLQVAAASAGGEE